MLLGEDDRLCTERWARELADLAEDGRLVTVPGPHTFLWRDPTVWSAQLRELVAREPAR